MGGACGMCGRQERCIQGFGEDIWVKETTWKIRNRWEGNIKKAFKYVGC
jgi:hypothetical protein